MPSLVFLRLHCDRWGGSLHVFPLIPLGQRFTQRQYAHVHRHGQPSELQYTRKARQQLGARQLVTQYHSALSHSNAYSQRR